jgi:hypothetical protein
VGRVMSVVRAERAIEAVAVARRVYRPSRAQWMPMLAAAALLLSVTTWLFESRATRPARAKDGRTFVFDLAISRPGQITSGVVLDSTLVPPSFASRTGGGR